MLDRKKLAPNFSQQEFDRIIKSQLIKILRANPWLSRFYAGYFQISSSNSIKTNNLADLCENFCDLNLKSPNPKGLNPMSLNKNICSCTHIKVNGLACGSPALKGEAFCYFHQRMIRGVASPPKSRLHPIALIENEEAIQASLMELINALVRNHIDMKRAHLIIRALHIAVKNSPRVRFHSSQSEMVREIPDYPVAPVPPKPVPPPISADVLAANAAAVAYLKAVEQKSAEAKEAQKKAAAEELDNAAELFQPAKSGVPQPAALAVPAKTAFHKRAGRVTLAPPVQKSAYGRSPG